MRIFVVLIITNKSKNKKTREGKKMNQTTIINKLNDLKYDGFKTAYLRQIEDINYNKLSFDERLYNLLESQEIFLHNNTHYSR